MRVNVVMPKLGESITEGTIIRWVKQPGERIQKDETLLDVGTDKVDSDIPSPTTGVVVEHCVSENDVVPVESVIAIIETEGEAAGEVSASTKESTPTPTAIETSSEHAAPTPERATPTPTQPVAKENTGSRFYSPLVLKMAQESGLLIKELEQVPGTGANGRVTKKDLQSYLESRQSQTVGTIDSAPTSARTATHAEPPLPSGDGIVTIPADYARVKLAEYMRNSVDTAAHAYLVIECDVTRVMQMVQQQKSAFLQEEGFKLTFNPYVLYAVSQALQQFPLVNSEFHGNQIVQHKHVNLGVAVQAEKGLVVPVVRHTETMNLRGLARATQRLVLGSRNNTLTADDFRGSSFTISNFGVYQSIMGLPIINQPNSAILGVGAVKKRPVVVETEAGDSIAIRSMVYLSLSLDHRLIDGALGAQFLKAICDALQDFPESA